MDQPVIDPRTTKTLLETPYIRVYDLAYEDGTHYYDASRRTRDDLLALKGEQERDTSLPDAVSCCLVLEVEGEEPRIVLTYEYRYPTGQFVLGIPSGLIDERDRRSPEPLLEAMGREIAEETGLVLGPGDSLSVVSPLLFNTPGMTDESTALLCAVVRRPDAAGLTQAAAEGTERFEGFELMTADEARRVLACGRDRHGHFYPMVTWAALTYFATGLWRSGFAAGA